MGGLAAGLGTTQARIQIFFFRYALIGLITAVLSSLLATPASVAARPSTLPAHRRQVAILSGLFALDSLGGGFVVPAVIAYWLHLRYGADVGVLGPTFAVLSLVGSLSYQVLGRLANQVGLIRTVLFTHLPSNVVLILVALAPTLP